MTRECDPFRVSQSITRDVCPWIYLTALGLHAVLIEPRALKGVGAVLVPKEGDEHYNVINEGLPHQKLHKNTLSFTTDESFIK